MQGVRGGHRARRRQRGVHRAGGGVHGPVQLHPDRGETADEERFKAVSRAYALIGDAEKRKRYDETGQIGSGRRRAFASLRLQPLLRLVPHRHLPPAPNPTCSK